MPEPVYRKLTPRKRSLAGYSQLWLADDHVLLVHSSRFSERYQRFRLADIQAISITEGPEALAFQIIAGLAGIAWAMLALLVSAAFGKWFFAITGGLILLLAIIDIARGPRCRCLLYTAVSQLRLWPVSRESIAQRFLEVLTPAIEAVQGPLPESVPAPPSLEPMPAPLPASGSRFGSIHVLFALYLLDALLAGLAHWFPRGSAVLILPTGISGELMLLLVTLIQAGSSSSGVARLVAIAGGACGIYDLVSIGRVFWSVISGLQAGTPPDFNSLLALPSHAVLFAVAWRLTAGVLGLLVLHAMRPRSAFE